MNYVIFDDKYRENFFPITLTRSTADLRSGILKLKQKLQGYFGMNNYSLILHKDIEKLYKQKFPKKEINKLKNGTTVFINSRLKVDEETVKVIDDLPENTAIQKENTILAAKLEVNAREVTSENLQELFNNLEKQKNTDLDTWKYLWELINENGKMIEKDFRDFIYHEDNHYDLDVGVTALNPYDIWVGQKAEVRPGVVLNASEGPIVIDDEAIIMSNSVIIGPAYIGKKSKIKALSKIYKATSVGPVCKIGGEVEETIFQAYTNKQHDGFLGHSYLGEWINLGADTNNSDLKNNYTNVDIYFYPKKRKINSNCQFLGCIIGDHSKTAINMSINTGTIIGVGANIFGKELIKDFVPSFTWGHSSNKEKYIVEKFFETADKVKKRRGLKILEYEKELYSQISNYDLV